MLQQQMQAQHLPHAHAPPIPMPPHPGGLPAPGLPPGSNAGLLGLAGASGLIAGHLPGVKDEKGLYTNGKVAKLHSKFCALREKFLWINTICG